MALHSMIVTRFLSTLLPESFDALVVTSGLPPDPRLLRALADRTFCIIAVDGGAETLRSSGIAPDHIVGDLDSASERSLRWAVTHSARVHRQPSEAQPDIAKGLTLCRKLGCKKIVVTGIIGHRLDHVLSALHFASVARGMNVILVTDEVAAFILRGRVRRNMVIPHEHSVSWFGLPSAQSCTLSGVRWPFTNRKLSIGGFHSLSNAPVSAAIHLEQRAGRSLFVVSLQPQVPVGKGQVKPVPHDKSYRK